MKVLRLLAITISVVFVFFEPLRAQTGDLRVVVSTSGTSIDQDGYVVALDTLRQSVSANGSAVFSRVIPGDHTAILLDVSENCVVSGQNPRKLMIAQGGVAEIKFEVACSESEPVPAQPIELPPAMPTQSAPPPTDRVPRRETARPSAPNTLPMGYYVVGHWVAVIRPPGFPSYPVSLTFYSEQALGEIVGRATYESTSPCMYDLLLEFVGDDFLVVAQQLISGSCANGGRVVMTRRADGLLAEWLTPEKNVWFEALFTRS